MKMDVEATYVNGVLKLDQPLPVADEQRLHVTIWVPPSRARQSAGLLSWEGPVEELEYLAENPENGPWERT